MQTVATDVTHARLKDDRDGLSWRVTTSEVYLIDSGYCE